MVILNLQGKLHYHLLFMDDLFKAPLDVML